MSKKRRQRYGLDDNPQFIDGEVVEVDTHYFGIPEKDAEYVEGVVIGKHEMGNSNAPYWIVDFGDKNWYGHQDYRAMVMPPCAICKRQEDLDEEVKLGDLLESLKDDVEEEYDELDEELDKHIKSGDVIIKKVEKAGVFKRYFKALK